MRGARYVVGDDFQIGPIQVQTFPAGHYHRIEANTTLARVSATILELIGEIRCPSESAHYPSRDGIVIRYLASTGEGDFPVEAGVMARETGHMGGRGRTESLPPFRCATSVVRGSLSHIAAAYDLLDMSVRQAGLEKTDECREWYHYLEHEDSPNNLTVIAFGLVSPEG